MADSNTMRVLTSSANEHWPTPRTIIDPLVKRFGQIALDPCSNAESIVNAKVNWYGPAHNDVDGLAQSWQYPGLVFVNPPYGRKIVSWVRKCAQEAEIAKRTNSGTEIVLLGPSRTDTKWFQRTIFPSADAVIFWEGRLTFLNAPAPAPIPSFLAYWGPNPLKFKLAFVGKGWCIP